MALNQEYFDSIKIEVAKKKYYNANKVEAVLADIREQALALNEENESLREQLQELEKFKCDISETLLSAKTISQGMIDDAGKEAERILEEAREQADKIVEEAEIDAQERIQESIQVESAAAEDVKRNIERIRAMHIRTILELDEVLQDFEDAVAAPKQVIQMPLDLEEKVGALASELFSIMGSGETEDEK